MIEPRTFRVDSVASAKEATDYIRNLKVGPGKVFEVTVEPEPRDHTRRQQKYWHAILAEMASALGHTPREMKEVVKRHYFLKSSESADRAGYGKMIDFTLQLAAEQGVVIRDPRPTATRLSTKET